MDAVIHEFSQFLIRNGKKPATLRAYMQTIKHLAAWMEETNGEPFSPGNITPIDLAEYKRHLMQRYKPATINRAVAGIKVFCTWAADQGRAGTGVADGLRRVADGRRVPKWLDRKEQLRLVRVVHRDGTPRDLALVMLMLHRQKAYRWLMSGSDLALVMLMLHGGLRVEETVTLLVEDVEISERKARLTVRWGKGDKWRQVPLNNDARKALVEYLGLAHPGGKWLFPGRRRRESHITTRAVWAMLKKYGYWAQVEVSPHRLRYTFCHNLARAGVPLDQVATLAGHFTNDGRPNIKTTVIYTQPGEADLRAAVDKISWDN